MQSTGQAAPADADFADRFFWQPHASPWSVWLLVLLYPVVVLAVYRRSRWLLAGVCLSVLANLHVVSPPEDDEAWATRVVLGERVWLEQGLCTSPRDLGVLGVGGAVQLFTFRSAVARRPGRTAIGAVASMALMFVFFGRMVRRYEAAG